MPQAVLERLSVLRHVARKRLRAYSEVDAGSLKESGDEEAEQTQMF